MEPSCPLLEKFKHEVLPAIEGVEGWLPPEQAFALYVAAAGLPGKFVYIAEIGSFKGLSAIVLAQAIKDKPGSFVVCIDPWDRSGGPEYREKNELGSVPLFAQFMSNVIQAGVGKIILPLKGKSAEVKWPLGEIDMLYIDGDHSYEAVRADLLRWTPLLRKGGVLAMDDVYYPDEGGIDGPYRAMLEVITSAPLLYWTLPTRIGRLLLTRKGLE